MRAPEQFETVADRGVLRLGGPMSLRQAVGLVTDAITFARERGLRGLLVNGLGVSGFDPPSMSERYFLLDEWAHAAGGVVRLALVARPEMLDPNRFGATVAQNRGLVAEVFGSEAEAMTWLDDPR